MEVWPCIAVAAEGPVFRHVYAHVFRHVHGHVYRRVYWHVHRHVFRHVCGHVFRYAFRHVLLMGRDVGECARGARLLSLSSCLCVDMCVDMCVDTCSDVFIGMCIDSVWICV